MRDFLWRRCARGGWTRWRGWARNWFSRLRFLWRCATRLVLRQGLDLLPVKQLGPKRPSAHRKAPSPDICNDDADHIAEHEKAKPFERHGLRYGQVHADQGDDDLEDANFTFATELTRPTLPAGKPSGKLQLSQLQLL